MLYRARLTYQAALAMHAAIAVVQTVDRGGELVMAPHGRHDDLARVELVVGNRVDGEIRFAGIRAVDVLARRIRQVEAAGMPDPGVVVIAARDDFGDPVAHQVVVVGPREPIDG